MMARVGHFNTAPERKLNAALRSMRVRYRSHVGLLGRPDVILVDARVAVFVHGCFWQGYPNHYTAPRSRARFWADKLAGNRARDSRVRRALRRLGWRTIVLWECQVNDETRLHRRFAPLSRHRVT